MKIEYLHASKYGNGAAVAAEFMTRMAARYAPVDIHHIREVKPTELSLPLTCRCARLRPGGWASRSAA